MVKALISCVSIRNEGSNNRAACSMQTSHHCWAHRFRNQIISSWSLWPSHICILGYLQGSSLVSTAIAHTGVFHMLLKQFRGHTLWLKRQWGGDCYKYGMVQYPLNCEHTQIHDTFWQVCCMNCKVKDLGNHHGFAMEYGKGHNSIWC